MSLDQWKFEHHEQHEGCVRIVDPMAPYPALFFRNDPDPVGRIVYRLVVELIEERATPSLNDATMAQIRLLQAISHGREAILSGELQ